MIKKDLNKFILNIDEERKTRIIRAALADDIPFENLKLEFNLTENEVIYFMKKSLPINQFIKWRKRARGSDLKNLKMSKIKNSFGKDIY